MNSNRYSRQIQLAQFGEKAQEKLFNAKVLVVGAGGLGIPVLTYLNAMGVGTLGIIDDDVVNISNLQRQVAYRESDVGKLKVDVLTKVLKAQNSETTLIKHYELLTTKNALALISLYDLVVDASDNFGTRYLVNDTCVILKKPFVYGALHGFEGQVSVFNYNEGPTYRCLFPDLPKANTVPNCDENGVLGVIPGIIGNLQALEVVKVITGIGKVLAGKLLLFDALQQNYQKISFKKVPENLEISQLKQHYGFDCATSFSTIDAHSFELILGKKSIQVVDVRTAEEFQEFHLENTIHIPLSDLENKPTELDVSQEIYVLCASGKRSQQAILILEKYFPQTNFINVVGGIQKFKRYDAKH
ncbi:HesA/MoeB/ThiF family protein [Cellulophaga sp. Hel_I_12]|uniref:HesA/MoeB/ThiF family protein n=1 Tax=Cellulophaga sp. Hel_I_12 TaxID=1249972 RepID=UPI00064665A0|nr:HesA/MoeB/ThiF family protein [Cellulophaga sp. Hel_I_12]